MISKSQFIVYSALLATAGAPETAAVAPVGPNNPVTPSNLSNEEVAQLGEYKSKAESLKSRLEVVEKWITDHDATKMLATARIAWAKKHSATVVQGAGGKVETEPVNGSANGGSKPGLAEPPAAAASSGASGNPPTATTNTGAPPPPAPAAGGATVPPAAGSANPPTGSPPTGGKGGISPTAATTAGSSGVASPVSAEDLLGPELVSVVGGSGQPKKAAAAPSGATNQGWF
jgi:hypothetical protein